MKDYMVTVNYGVKEFPKPTYWYEHGKIHCSTGSAIGYESRKMTRQEAEKMALEAGIILNAKAT
jgi:hypothetical protein